MKPRCTRRGLLVAGLGSGLTAQAAAPPRIAFDAASLPTQFAGPKEICLGLYPAIVREALQAMGETGVQFSPLPFKRLIEGLQRAENAAGAVIRTPERERYAVYSRAYYDEALVIVVGPDGALPRQLEALQGRRLAVIRGWSYGPQLDTALARGDLLAEAVTADRQSLEMLRRGRVDAVVITQLAWQLLRRQEPSYASLREAFAANSNGIHLALPRSWPDAATWLQGFDHAVATLRAAGAVTRLTEQALRDAQQHGVH